MADHIVTPLQMLSAKCPEGGLILGGYELHGYPTHIKFWTKAEASGRQKHKKGIHLRYHNYESKLSL